MWPLAALFLLATAAAPQHPQNIAQNTQPEAPTQITQPGSASSSKAQSNLCFTIRTYHFRHQDGQPPMPAGISTCTPANILQKRQVSRTPRALFIPLAEKPVPYGK